MEKAWADATNNYSSSPERKSIHLLPEVMKQVRKGSKVNYGKMVDFFEK
jgi:hypothetical protein